MNGTLKSTKRKEQRSVEGAPGMAPEDLEADGVATVGVEDPPPAEPAGAPKAPVAVGRSLEANGAADACMELLIDKLKLLDYENEYCRKKKPYRKTLPRAFFVMSIPGSDQFQYFSGLAAWLLTLGGVDTPTPKVEDDPQSISSNLIAQAGKLGFGKPSYAGSKLSMGWGKEVCGFLDGLVDYVLERRRFAYKTPVHKAETQEAEEAADDDDGGMEGADEMAGAALDDYEDDGYMDGIASEVTSNSVATPAENVAERQVLVSKVDPTLWKLELERVTPKLRITIAADSRDWRNHLDEAHTLHKTIMDSWPESKTALERLLGDLGNVLEKLQSREKFLNEQFENLMQQYRAARVHLADAQENYNKRTENVADRNSELSRITEQIEEIKHVLDERGTTIGDATPVARIKAAIKRLEEELHQMAVKIGVVSNAHLQLSLKNRRMMQSQAGQLSDDDDD